MSSSFGGGGQGQIKYSVIVDDSNAGQTIQSLRDQFRSMGDQIHQQQQQLEQMAPALDDIAESGNKAKLSQEQLTLSQKSFGSVMKDSVLGIGMFASGIVGLISQYTSLQRAQNSFQRAQNMERTQVLAITKQRDKLNQTIAKYGEGSAEAQRELEKLNIMEAKHSTQVEKIELMQEQLNQRTAEFYIQIIPNVIQASAGLFDTVLNVKKWNDARNAAAAAGVAVRGVGVSMKTALIGTGIGAILVAIGTALVAFTQNWYGFRDAVNEAGVAIGNMIPQLRPLLAGLTQFGNLLVKIFGGELIQSAEAAVPAIGDVSDATGELGIEAGKAQKEIADMWKEISEAPNLTSALKIEVDKDKLTKKLLDYLPDSLTKDIKVFIKGRESVETLRDSFAEILSIASDMGKDDKWANKFVKQTVKTLKEKFPNAPGSKELQEALAGTVSGPDTLQKAKELIEKWKLDPALTIDTSNVKVDMSGLATSFESAETDIGVTDAGKKSTYVEGILGNVKKSIENFDWSGTADTILSGILKVSTNASSKIGEWLKGTFTKSNFEAGLATVTDLFTNFTNWFWEGLKNPEGRREQIAGFVVGIVNAISAAFPKTTVELQALGGTMIGYIGDGISKLQGAFLQMAVNFVDGLATGIQNVPDLAGKIWAAFVKGITSSGKPPELKLPDGTTVIPPDAGITMNNGGTLNWAPEKLNVTPPTDPEFIGPIKPSALDVDTSGATITYVGNMTKSQKNKQAALDLLKSFGDIFLGLNAPLPIPELTLQPKTIKINDVPGPRDDINPLDSSSYKLISGVFDTRKKDDKTGGSMFSQLFKDIDLVIKSFTALGTHVSKIMNSIGANAKSGGAQMYKALNQSIENVAGVMNTFAKHWSKVANSLGANGKSAGSQIFKALNQAIENVAGVMNTFAKHWSKVCNSLINNAKSAAKGINSALSKIKDVEVTVHVGLSGPGVPFIGKGGTFTRLAKGGLVTGNGIISAAQGYTTNGPQLAIIGDNPGGRETVAVVPHNDPWPTMSLLAKQFGKGGSGGTETVNINLTLPISGSEFINERNLRKMIKLELGKNRDRFM